MGHFRRKTQKPLNQFILEELLKAKNPTKYSTHCEIGRRLGSFHRRGCTIQQVEFVARQNHEILDERSAIEIALENAEPFDFSELMPIPTIGKGENPPRDKQDDLQWSIETLARIPKSTKFPESEKAGFLAKCTALNEAHPLFVKNSVNFV